MLLLRGATLPKRQIFRKQEVSIHAPLARSNSAATSVSRRSRGFNTCSSCEEQQAIRVFSSPETSSFNTCSSCEEQREPTKGGLSDSMFQYMLLLRGATARQGRKPRPLRFNTCSSCEEQLCSTLYAMTSSRFQYMLLLRGATQYVSPNIVVPLFQYMLLLRGATSSFDGDGGCADGFNTCSSCEEQHFAGELFLFFDVSIHAPLARSNLPAVWHLRARTLFQYMLLLRGATDSPAMPRRRKAVSIHAPLARSNLLFVP